MKIQVILSEQVSEPVEVSVITPPKTPEICARIEGDEIHVEWTGISAAYELTFGNNGGIVKTTANDYFEGAIPGMTQSYTVVAVNLAGRSAPATTSITVPEAPKYVEIPAPPVFADPVTITIPSAGLTIFPSALNGKKEVILSPVVSSGRVALNGLGGTETAPIRFKGIPGTVIGGPNADPLQRVISTVNATDHIELFNLNLKGGNGGVMLSGSKTVAKTIRIQDVVCDGHGFAGIWINTEDVEFKSIMLEFVRSFDLFTATDGGEARYIGSTKKTALSRIGKYSEKHGYCENSGREALQLTGTMDMFISNITAINSGVSNIGGQNRLHQFQYCNGQIINSIFDGGTGFIEHFSHGVSYINNYYRWSNGNGGYIGKAGTNVPNHPTSNHKPIIKDSNIYAPDKEVINLFDIVEDQCDVIIRNNITNSNVKNLYLDKRVDKQSFKIITENNVNAIPEPVTYMEEPEDVWRKAKLVTSKYHLDRKMGYRTI